MDCGSKRVVCDSAPNCPGHGGELRLDGEHARWADRNMVDIAAVVERNVIDHQPPGAAEPSKLVGRPALGQASDRKTASACDFEKDPHSGTDEHGRACSDE